MRIGITGNTGAICLKVVEEVSAHFNTPVEMLSLFGDEWEGHTFDYDVLIHIAGVIPSPTATKEEYYKINHQLTARVAKKAHDDGCRHFVMFSTMAVYGMQPSVKPGKGIVYANSVCTPTTDYGKSKLAGEDAVRALEYEHFKAAFLRIPSVYSESNTAFLNVARDMYHKFPKYFPKVYTGLGRSAICIQNLCACINLVIEQQVCGIVCPHDTPVCSLYDYMTLINQVQGSPKKPSAILGFAIKLIMLFKPSLKEVFGAIVFDYSLADCMQGAYRIIDSKKAIENCLLKEQSK